MRLKLPRGYILLFISTLALAQQKRIEEGNENWTQIFYQARVSEKISLLTDAGFRFKELLVSPTQSLLRVGGGYHFNKNAFLAGGYSYFIFYEAANDAKIPNYEHRTWQRLTINNTMGKFLVTHRYRLEQRWIRKIASNKESLSEGYRYNNRFGYQLNIQMPLRGEKIEPKVPYMVASDEIFINFGKEIVYNQFDQNRFFVGLGYQFTKNIGFIAGYQHIWQQRASGLLFREQHCARLNLLINTDFRKNYTN